MTEWHGGAYEFGREFCKGAMQWIGFLFVIGLLIAFAYHFCRAEWGWALDNTDLNGWNRSGMTLHIDYKTGVQYLSDGDGGMVPRVDKDGNLVIYGGR